jgi:tetratricopeptide (TPR) repeat protein
MVELEQEWLKGRSSLGAAAKWTAEEIRLVSELGYSLAEQGRIDEAIALFEGLAALAPATAYFQAALGSLFLRDNQPEIALKHLNSAVHFDSKDLFSLVNRGEVYLRLGKNELGLRDLKKALQQGRFFKFDNEAQTPLEKCLVRAKALLVTTEKFGLLKT